MIRYVGYVSQLGCDKADDWLVGRRDGICVIQPSSLALDISIQNAKYIMLLNIILMKVNFSHTISTSVIVLVSDIKLI